MVPEGAVVQRSPMIAVLEDRDIDLAVQLSTAAGWNQTASDWRTLARLYPDGCFGIHSGGNLVATATLICHGGRLGWIGMVLTHPGYRRRGFARALLDHVVQRADVLGIESLKLDATDQGQRLYESLGFRAEQPVERWWMRGDSEPTGPNQRGQFAEPSAAMDREAFGVDRSRLLYELGERSAVFTSEDGFALLRAGVRASYAGPCVARNAEAARGLMTACIREAGTLGCFWDLLPRNGAATELARELGFLPQRQLIRMVRGASGTGREDWIYGIAGFELG